MYGTSVDQCNVKFLDALNMVNYKWVDYNKGRIKNKKELIRYMHRTTTEAEYDELRDILDNAKMLLFLPEGLGLQGL